MKYILALCSLALTLSLQAQPTDLFLFFGQSNMAGRAAIEGDTLLMNNVLILNSEGDFIPAKNPLNRYSTIRKDDYSMQRLGPAYAFSKTIAAHLKDTIRIIVQARGGTPIEKFMKGSDWAYYESIVNRTKNALARYPDSRLRAIIFHQGESNSGHPEGYIEKLSQVFADLRADLDVPNLPIFFGELGPWRDSYKEMRRLMRKIPEEIPYTYLVSSKDLTNQDEAHFDHNSAIEFGKRYAEKCIEVVYK
ncbi:MAG: sialate O-acetylesterase [Bacteroidota bacterium]